jgi:hypothetical protein
MTPVAWMSGLGMGSWLAIRVATSGRLDPEVLLGMVAPLTSAILTWTAVERTHKVAPARVTSVLMWGFALKTLVFGMYVVAMLRPAALRPIPFVVSFTGYFIALHVMEALFLKRLMGNASS